MDWVKLSYGVGVVIGFLIGTIVGVVLVFEMHDRRMLVEPEDYAINYSDEKHCGPFHQVGAITNGPLRGVLCIDSKPGSNSGLMLFYLRSDAPVDGIGVRYGSRVINPDWPIKPKEW